MGEATASEGSPTVVRHRAHASTKPCISFVVVGFSTGPELQECLRRCLHQPGLERDELELILVDNGGLEPGLAGCRSLLDAEVTMHRNAGPSAARNEGAKLATAPLVAFVDDDGWVAPDWAAAALAAMADGSRVACRGKVVFKRHRLFTALANVYDLGPIERDDLLSLEGNLVVDRDAFLEVGGFDPSLFGGEGLDLAFKLRQRFPERALRYVPALLMQHDYCDSWAKFYRKSRRYSSRDRARQTRRPEVQALLLEHRRAYPVTKPWLRWHEWPLVWLLEQLRRLIRSLPDG
jgi:GT2 family glycosyltransferase